MTLVETIDIAGWATSDAATRAALAAEMDHGLREIGFLLVTGHGLPPSTVSDALEAIDGFFALPDDEKRRWRPPQPSINRGYSPLGSEALAFSIGVDTPPDLMESFVIGTPAVDRAHPPGAGRAESFFAPNIWPTRPPGLRSALESYFDAVNRLARSVLGMLAVALGLDERHFDPFVTRSTETLKCNWYDPAAGPARPGQQRLGAHTDYGLLTMLHADPVPGLQVLAASDTWVDVVAPPGAVVVNVGDLMAQWTNDRWRSTLHRVIPSGRRRRSIAFFPDGNHDAVIECLPSCCSPERPARYPPVVAGEHLLAKITGGRTYTVPTDSVDTLGHRAEALEREH